MSPDESKPTTTDGRADAAPEPRQDAAPDTDDEGSDTTLRRTGLSRSDDRASRSLPARDEIELLHPTAGLEPYPGVFMPDIEQERRGMAGHRPTARRFLALFLAFLLLQGAGVVGFNYTVNPRSEFAPELFEPLVLNDVRLKADLLADQPAPDILILGSSRSITLNASLLANDTISAFNFAISDGNVAEQRAILRYVTATKGPPQAIIVGLDPHRMIGAQEVREHVQTGLPDRYLEDPPSALERARAVLDTYELRYLKDSLSAARYTVLGAPPSSYSFDPDGQRHFRPFEDPAFARDHDVDRAIERTIDTLRMRVGALDRLEERDIPELRKLVEDAHRDGTTVHLFFTPMHPRVWDAMADTALGGLMDESRSLATSLCADDVHVHDMSHIERFGGDPDDFYDGWHYVDDTADAALRAVMSGTLAICA